METLHTKKFVGTPFILTAENIPATNGSWDSMKVSIYRDENLIGEYIRNYSSYAPMTFYPFEMNGEWYALYSAHYTTTRVMKLHEDKIEDWCGEEPQSNGFCPVEYYIPRYNKSCESMTISGELRAFDIYQVDHEYTSPEAFVADWKTPEFVETKFCNFAFMCGCVWGDDTSWKLRYIELAGVPNKELLITEKFGYWELPTQSTLRQCINMSSWEPEHDWIELTRMEHFNLRTGERC
jgi:hypothetical protein